MNLSKLSFLGKITSGILEDKIEYCKKLIEVIKSNEVVAFYPANIGI